MTKENINQEFDQYSSVGHEAYGWIEDLFPICRSITGNGLRKSLKYFQSILLNFKIHEVASGTKIFDWEIPNEWNISEAYVKDETGRKIIDMKNNNLHVLQYSTPVEGYFTLKQLQEHLYSEPQIPDAIPYRTSFFEPNWGFCLKHSELLRLKNVEYYVKINSKITKGSLTYGELKIPSTQGNKEEILFSTYICHPSMANNELSGPAICAALAKEIYKISNRRYNYRFVYVPETIGCLAFLKENLTELQQSVIAGFQVTCVGNNGPFSYLPSREENNLSDRLIKAVAIGLNLDLKVYPFQQRGSDERQYCHPRVNLPVASLMRSKYGNYKEYHTSGDNLNFISPEGLSGSFAFYLTFFLTLLPLL